MAIQGFCPPSPSHSPSHSHSHSPYYQLLERGSARLGRVKNSGGPSLRSDLDRLERSIKLHYIESGKIWVPYFLARPAFSLLRSRSSNSAKFFVSHLAQRVFFC